jgi:ribose-phosphate pyrophosphokinase
MTAHHVFALNATAPFGERIAASLGHPLSPHEEREFEDGEHKVRPLTGVRGSACYVIQSLHAGPDQTASEKLIRLLFFAGALKQSGAANVTALVPFLAYARKDRRTKSRDPVATRLTAQLVEAAGIDHIVTLETHNLMAFENAFRIPADNLSPYANFVDHVRRFAGSAPLIVASPDPGGVKRAQIFREYLEWKLKRDIGFALLEKRRSGGEVSGTLFAGNVAGAHAIILDDMIASGGTMARAAKALKSHGATRIAAYASHGMFAGGASPLFESADIDEILVTDSVPYLHLPESHRKRVDWVSVAPLFARAIEGLSGTGSFTDLLIY